jgi:NCAIR mutase (PurE)-related protein
MDKEKLKSLLDAVANKQVTADEAMEQLRRLPYEELGFAKIDLHRQLRQGMPEVIYCPGKTAGQVIEIARRLRQHHKLVLASRATADLARQVLAEVEDCVYSELASMIICGEIPQPDDALPAVAIITAGTADLPVAEEAAVVLQAVALPVVRVNDVGVAGIHRLFDNLETIEKTEMAIVVAGMDGALPSVVAGLLGRPVIAVPTSVGYGASFAGMAALLTMLNSCAAGLTVVNIDNGFGAAMACLRIAQAVRQARDVAAERQAD